MNNFSVTYRGKDGKQEIIQIAAEDRKGVFDEFAKRGITAIRVEEGKVSKPKSSISRKPSYFKGLVAGTAVVALSVVAWLMLTPEGSEDNADKVRKPRKIASAEPAPVAPQPRAEERKSKPATAASVAREYNEQIKEFVRKSPTNNVTWIVAPLDPNDPDNALRTRVTQELGSLLSVEPGEPMPPFPYSFLMEDDMKDAAARGEDVGEIDNGNKAFLESLQKWRITAKETDNEHRLNRKEMLVQAQQELLDGLNDGISVNDSIRAAYEFRKRAYEFRSTIVSTLTEMAAEGEPPETTVKMLRDVNKQLSNEGIKTIPIDEILPDYEEADEQEHLDS